MDARLAARLRIAPGVGYVLCTDLLLQAEHSETNRLDQDRFPNLAQVCVGVVGVDCVACVRVIAPPCARFGGEAVSVETTETETEHAATAETAEEAATAKPADHAATAEAAVPRGATILDLDRSVRSDRRLQRPWHAGRAAVVGRATGVAALLLPLLLLLPLPLLLLLHRILRGVLVGALAGGSAPLRVPVEVVAN